MSFLLLFAAVALMCGTTWCQASIEMDLAIESLLKAVKQLEKKSEFDIDDLSDLRALCNETATPNCIASVHLLARAIKYINNRVPPSSASYYHFIIIGLVVGKFVIVGAVTYFSKLYIRRHKRAHNEKTKRESIGGDSTIPSHQDVELANRDSFVEYVKNATLAGSQSSLDSRTGGSVINEKSRRGSSVTRNSIVKKAGSSGDTIIVARPVPAKRDTTVVDATNKSQNSTLAAAAAAATTTPATTTTTAIESLANRGVNSANEADIESDEISENSEREKLIRKIVVRRSVP